MNINQVRWPVIFVDEDEVLTLLLKMADEDRYLAKAMKATSDSIFVDSVLGGAVFVAISVPIVALLLLLQLLTILILAVYVFCVYVSILSCRSNNCTNTMSAL